MCIRDRHKPFADCVNIVHAIGEVPKIAPARVIFGVPVECQFHHGSLILPGAFHIFGCRKKNERETSALIVDPADLLQAQLAAIEVECRIEIGDSHHGVEIAH